MPDFDYINGIPIVDVARKIGLEFSEDGQIVCWRSDRHKDGRTAFIRVLQSNKVKCDACDTYPMSVLDMVKDFGGFDSLVDAAECVAFDFKVPRIPKGSHLKNPDCQIVPPACEDPIRLLVVSGVWAGLPVPVQRLLPALLKLAEWKDGSSECVLRLSNRAMMRYSGIRNPNSIKPALTQMEAMGWLERLGSPARGDSPIKGTAAYRLTPLSQQVRELADATSPPFGDAIRTEKAAREGQRKGRARVLALRRGQRA